ncbi:hypothetical protein DSL92_05180 [Billgrantia gudaonensis]|uniref:Uncharacterized protein n=1 Tax=Billgrantia gudaonensis TaxID=376427 RepID=A0A3S0QFX5_9GAMM|nr:hypothetical protein DSL92_05180 [Halomonas gudaonensis]
MVPSTVCRHGRHRIFFPMPLTAGSERVLGSYGCVEEGLQRLLAGAASLLRRADGSYRLEVVPDTAKSN